ncbi:hypothetical protein F5Y16DRAFT_422337 [Xylariaceae sp. FL0255]|nr:hypothetical protein F5Y16DRAFT_422337 [Xylariaceae sp. FL0255]
MTSKVSNPSDTVVGDDDVNIDMAKDDKDTTNGAHADDKGASDAQVVEQDTMHTPLSAAEIGNAKTGDVVTVDSSSDLAATPEHNHSVTPSSCTDTHVTVRPVAKFHDDVDIEIIVTEGSRGDKCGFEVCSALLSAASTVWRSLLLPNHPSINGQTNGAQDLKAVTREAGLPRKLEIGGNVKALNTLFDIVHFNFAKVPADPTIDQLYHLCTNATAYDCTSLLYPWAAHWASALNTFATDENCYVDCHKVLRISYTFGDIVVFRDAIDAIVVSAKMNGDGKLTNVNGENLDDLAVPEGLLDTIKELRLSIIGEVLDALQTPLLESMSPPHARKNQYCKIGKDIKECEAILLGSTIPALMTAGLFPVPKPKEYSGSFFDLKDTVGKIKTLPFVGRDWAPHMAHDNCSLGFSEVIDKCMNNMTVNVPLQNMEWMSNQCDVCGVKPADEIVEFRATKAAKAADAAEDD